MALTNYGGSGGTTYTGLQPHDATGAVAHWTFDGTVVEAITGGAGYDVSLTSPGFVGVNALGATQYSGSTTIERSPGVLTANAALQLSGDMTAAGWLCLGETPTSVNQELFSCGKRSSTLGWWGFSLDGTSTRLPQAYWCAGAAEQTLTGTTKMEVGRWYHLCMTRGVTGTRGRIYVNGVLEHEDAGLTNVSTTYAQVNWGHNAGGTSSHVMMFSNIIFDAEKDAAAVLALYNSTLAV